MQPTSSLHRVGTCNFNEFSAAESERWGTTIN